MPWLSFPLSSETTIQTQPKPAEGPNPNPPDPFVSLLRDSADRFIADYRNAASDFSNFSAIFSRLIHSVRDPPLEVVWFYSAVIFHGTKLTTARRDRVSAVKDSFQLIVSCSASSRAAKRIAALAPVVSELCYLAFEEEQFERDEIRRLLEGLVSYFSICSAELRAGAGDDEHELNSCFSEAVRVWMVDRFGPGDESKAFFPMASVEVHARMRMRERSGFGNLAGIVMFQAFLLRLCLRFGIEISRAELEKDVRSCAAQMITSGFRCFSFLDTLFKTLLLEPVLPVANLLKSKDECFLREVLFDSVIMGDSSFFKPHFGLLLSSECLKNLAVTWVVLADKAIRLIRENDDQRKLISYMSAFSESCLASHLIKWLTTQIDLQGKIVPKVTTPVALIKWMLLVEEQGVRVFGCEISKVKAKGAICNSRVECVLPFAQSDGDALGDNDLEMVDTEEDLGVHDTMKKPAIDGQRKRKEIAYEEMEIQVKLFKYDFHENSVKKFTSCGSNNGLSAESDVGDPVPVGDMADMQQ